MNAGKVIFDTEINNKSFDKQIDQLKGRIEEIEHMLSKPKEFNLSGDEITKLNVELEKSKNKLGDLVKKQNQLNEEGFKKVSFDLDGIIKKVGKLILAVFGVSSAYSAIRSAMGTLSEYNEQLATDIKYIQFALAKMLERVIKVIINLTYQLLNLINSIAMSWFNINLFENAGIKNFKKMNKEASSLKKTLTTLSFDTANILSDTSVGGGAGGGDVFEPSVDLSKLDGTKEKLSKFWDDITKFWKEDWEDFFTIKGNWNSFIYGLGLTLKGFYDIFDGVIQSIKGLLQIAVGFFKGDFDLINEGWNNLCKGLVKILQGAIEIITGLFLIVGGFIKGIFLDIWDGIKKIFGNIGSWFSKNVISPIKNAFNSLPGWMQTLIKGIVNTSISMLNKLINGLNGLLTPARGIITAIGNVMGQKWSLGNIKIPTIPKLAVGGVVNMPGRGVYYGGGNIGEKGAEGVIPLTNDQSLQMIADAIAQKMNITIDITNKMDGRVLNKQLEQVRAKNNFARNGV